MTCAQKSRPVMKSELRWSTLQENLRQFNLETANHQWS